MVVKAIAAGFAQNVDCTAVYIWIFKDKKVKLCTNVQIIML